MMTLCPLADIFLMVSLVKSDSLLSEFSRVPSKSTAIIFFVIFFLVKYGKVYYNRIKLKWHKLWYNISSIDEMRLFFIIFLL